VPEGDGNWVVKRPNTSSSRTSFSRKADAVAAAREIVGRGGGELVIHNRDGRIAEANTYPKGFGSLKNKFVIREGIDFKDPVYRQVKPSARKQ
jgi:hypothetical protein